MKIRLNPCTLQSAVVGILLLCASGSTGCDAGHGASVEGRVTLDGAPLTKGTVTYHPDSEGPTAYGVIQRNGTYALKTGSRMSLRPGDYKVTVTASTLPSPTAEEPEPLPELLTPASYSRVDSTSLRFTVTPGRNHIDLKLLSSQ